MALLDFLKNRKKPKEQPEKVSVKSETKKTPTATSINRRGFAYEAVKQPHISEKATYLSEKDQYVFEVLAGYNKEEIKKAIEGIYGVNVLSVNVVKIPAKKRRLGRTEGFKKGYKKAIVKIKQGQKIEIL